MSAKARLQNIAFFVNPGANPFAQQFPAGVAWRRNTPNAPLTNVVNRFVNTANMSLSKVNRKIFTHIAAREPLCVNIWPSIITATAAKFGQNSVLPKAQHIPILLFLFF